jgi:hypothetical protein
VSWIGNPKGDDLLFLHIGGMDDDEHVQWSAPRLMVGDEITIKVVHDASGDPPTTRRSVEQMDQLAADMGQAREGDAPE